MGNLRPTPGLPTRTRTAFGLIRPMLIGLFCCVTIISSIRVKYRLCLYNVYIQSKRRAISLRI